MKKFIWIVCFLTIFNGWANIGRRGFYLFSNHYFVETGTLRGDALAIALRQNFKDLRSIEYDPNYYEMAKERFLKRKNVKIWQGDSRIMLWEMIQDINGNITFWLDAHAFPPSEGISNCPLLEELEQIKRHPIKTHTILIDDMNCSSTASFDFITKEEIIQKILEINPTYQIQFIAGGDEDEVPNNILVAKPQR